MSPVSPAHSVTNCQAWRLCGKQEGPTKATNPALLMWELFVPMTIESDQAKQCFGSAKHHFICVVKQNVLLSGRMTDRKGQVCCGHPGAPIQTVHATAVATHCMQATSEELHANLLARVQCELGQSLGKNKSKTKIDALGPTSGLQILSSMTKLLDPHQDQLRLQTRIQVFGQGGPAES